MNEPGVDRKVCDLIDELCSLADAKEMPVIHLGTDEVRNKEEYVRRTGTAFGRSGWRTMDGR